MVLAQLAGDACRGQLHQFSEWGMRHFLLRASLVNRLSCQKRMGEARKARSCDGLRG